MAFVSLLIFMSTTTKTPRQKWMRALKGNMER